MMNSDSQAASQASIGPSLAIMSSTGRTVRRPERTANRPSAAASGIVLTRCQGRTRPVGPGRDHAYRLNMTRE
jgi:hypothetical protein